eukprot:10169771-Alexandrium_andersonii.AAC.1
MSASLVGSEMCIRDRGPLSELPRQTRAAPGSFKLQGAPESGWQPMPCETVSYTHLTLPTICSV